MPRKMTVGPANIINFSICPILSDAVGNFTLDAIKGSYPGPHRLNGRSILLRNHPTQSEATTVDTLTTPELSGMSYGSEQIVSISLSERSKC